MALSAAPVSMLAHSPAHNEPQYLSGSVADSDSDQLLQCNYPSNYYSCSPRQYPLELPDPILEEGDESSSESPIEPVTPVSGRQSQEFTTLQHSQDLFQHYQGLSRVQSEHQSLRTETKAPILSAPSYPAPSPPLTTDAAPLSLTPTYSSQDDSSVTPKATTPSESVPPQTLTRRPTRGSTSSFRRTMSSFFRRSNSQIDRESNPFDSRPPNGSDSVLTRHTTNTMARPPTSIPYQPASSVSGYSNSTMSNSPSSPGSPLEMAPTNRSSAIANGDLPEPADFKKKRTGTGFSLRGRAVNFVGSRGGTRQNKPAPRRASSFDAGHRVMPPHHSAIENAADGQTFPPERLPWAMPPEAGTGAKARRMSLSLPDDFNVDVAELLNEFEYLSKFGRHGKHLGKGAASKVTLMTRKGCVNELYAVKEFRGKSGRESKDDYDKKIKSEYSIGKSLHHPNIVETIRLCGDHGRWNHVMEYCSEGDLFSLVQKGFLKGEAKQKDRLCLFKQLIQGVGYLHANGIAHRDIKLENLLITKDSKLKITDFGVSEVFCGTHPGLREAGGQCGTNMAEIRLCSPGICGSEPYIAPEVLEKKEQYDPRALDVWGSAIVMIYMIFGGAIWSRAERGNLHYDKLVAGWAKWNKKHDSPDACITETDYPVCQALDVGVNPPALRRVLLQMLNPNPKKRITINEVLNNRWVKNIECCQLESYDDPSQMIDATKKDYCNGKNGSKKIFCHSHLPLKSHGSHSLGKMPGQPGY